MCARALAHLQKVDGLTILGPADCPLERLNGKWRRHLLIKHESHLAEIGAALDGLEEKGVTLTIDVDAYSLM
jgi:primosomal protein N'